MEDMKSKLQVGVVEDAVTWEKISEEKQKLRFFFNLTMNKEIDVMEDFLNRILFDKPWTDNNNLKSFQYMDTFFHGAWNVEKFILVPTDLVKSELLKKLDLTKNEKVRTQLNRGLKIVNEKINKKVKYLIIDGMGRTFTTWEPFFRNKLRIADKSIIEEIKFIYADGKTETINGKLWSDISDVTQESILEQNIDLAIVESGNLNKITMCLISKNNNEKFTDWQLLYHRQFISPLGFDIKDVLTEPIRDFLKEHTTISGTKYKLGKSGFEWFIALLLIYLSEHKVPKLGKKSNRYENAFDEESVIVGKKQVADLKKYLMELVDAFPQKNTSSESKETVGFVRNYVIFRDLIENRNSFNLIDAADLQNIKGKIANTKIFINEWFILENTNLLAKYWPGPVDKNGNITKILNSYSYTEDKGDLIKTDNGYAKSFTDENDKNIKNSLRILKERFIKNLQKLRNINAWKDTTRSDTPSTRDVAVFREWKDRDGNIVTPADLGNYVKGHIIPEKDPNAETIVENLVLQETKGNAHYGARALIGDKHK